MATKTIGSGVGRDYVTLAAWASYLSGLALSGPEDGQCYNDSEFSFSALVMLGGWTGASSTNTVTLHCAAGQSFRDNATAQTNALRYNQSNGVGVKMTANYSSALAITGNWFILDGLQVSCSGSATAHVLDISGANCTFQNSIIQGTLNNVNNSLVATSNGSTFQNLAIINRGSTGVCILVQAASTLTDLTIAASNSSAGTGIQLSYHSTSVVKNVAVFGSTTDYQGTASASSSNNATDKASFGGTNFGSSGQTSCVGSTELQSITLNSEDLRLNSTSVKMKDGGATAGPSTDIVGTPRPSGTAYDIGCWELIQFRAAWVQNQTSVGDDAMYLKNTAGQYLGFALINATTGAALTGATVTAYRIIDGGSQNPVTGTISEPGGIGQYRLAMSQLDTNGNDITFFFTASNAVPVEKSITTESPSAGSVPLVLSQWMGSNCPPGTVTVPSWATRARVGVMGAGGGGAGSNTATDRCSGGAGGGYTEAVLAVVPGETLTITNAAGGAAGSNASGSPGGTASIAAGTSGWTLSSTGGGGGNKSSGTAAAATGGTGSGGDINSTGGASGACSVNGSASGGGAPGHPKGNGAASGSVSGVFGATGGAGLQGASGSITGGTTSAATGGGGVNFPSGSISSGTNTATGGGGAISAGTNNSSTAGRGAYLGVSAVGTSSSAIVAVTPVLGQTPLIDAALLASGAGSAGNIGSAVRQPEAGGGGGAATTADVATGCGGLGAGTGANANSNGSARGPQGVSATFGGGGAAVASATAGAGFGGLGAGGGAAVGTSGIAGPGGDSYIFIIFMG